MNLYLPIICGVLIGLAFCSPNLDLNKLKTLSDDEAIEYINSLNLTWKAGPNNLKKSGNHWGMKVKNEPVKLPYFIHKHIDNLPESFDAREKWPKCTTIPKIQDQGGCGSCWAVSAVATMSDRLCIHTNGEVNLELSAMDLLDCCSNCIGYENSICSGGYMTDAWQYIVQNGLVTGNYYTSGNDSCQPYDIDHFKPKCTKKCRSSSKKSYKDDKHFGIYSYSIQKNETQIMQEIYKNGPVNAGFHPGEALYTYKHGVYIVPKPLNLHGGHAIRIIGWGVENGLKYWLCANSWGRTWGMAGYFKILRGTNEGMLEQMVMAGIPMEYIGH